MDIGDIFRKATRPIVTIIFAAVLAQVVVERIAAPDWFIALAIPVILWWFGERTLSHIKTKTPVAEVQTSNQGKILAGNGTLKPPTTTGQG